LVYRVAKVGRAKFARRPSYRDTAQAAMHVVIGQRAASALRRPSPPRAGIYSRKRQVVVPLPHQPLTAFAQRLRFGLQPERHRASLFRTHSVYGELGDSLGVVVWLALTAADVCLGVSRAGYSFAEELPIFVVLLSVSSVVAIFGSLAISRLTIVERCAIITPLPFLLSAPT
jgi:hypothetical protein